MGFREVSRLQGVIPGLSDFTVTEGFFFSFLTRDQVGTTVVKIEDAKISPTLPSSTKAWPSLP